MSFATPSVVFRVEGRGGLRHTTEAKRSAGRGLSVVGAEPLYFPRRVIREGWGVELTLERALIRGGGAEVDYNVEE